MEFHNGLKMKILNVHITGSYDPIDFPFTEDVYSIIRCSHIEYLRNLKMFINLVFLKILWLIYIL